MIATERSKWELKNEKNKVNIRWLLTLVVGGYLSYLLNNNLGNEIGAKNLFHWWFIGGLTASIAIINICIGFYIFRCKKNKSGVTPLLKYFTMSLDFLVISLVLIPTGGDNSMFFVVYFIVIVSNSLRYGMRLSIIGLITFNIFYFGVLAYQYPESIFTQSSTTESIFSLQKEILKVGVFWMVGIYTGYIARRFEFLQVEVEKYQKLVERLMQRSSEKIT